MPFVISGGTSGYTGLVVSGWLVACGAGSSEPGGGVISPVNENVHPDKTTVRTIRRVNAENLGISTLKG